MLSFLAVAYLFLGGTGAGVCFVLGILTLLTPRDMISEYAACRLGERPRDILVIPHIYRKLFVPGYAAATVILMLGILCLVMDLGRLDQVFLLFTRPTLSFVAVGAWLLAAGIAVAVATAALWMGFFRSIRTIMLRVLAVSSLLISAAVMIYTGLFLQSLHAVPFWSTPFLPVLFVLSSLSCGIALVLITMQLTETIQSFTMVREKLLIGDGILIVGEVIVMTMWLLMALNVLDGAGAGALTNSDVATSNAALDLIEGNAAPWFWGGFVAIGLVVPLLLEWIDIRSGRTSPLSIPAIAACVLVGGFIMRFCITEVGIHPMLSMMVIG